MTIFLRQRKKFLQPLVHTQPANLLLFCVRLGYGWDHRRVAIGTTASKTASEHMLGKKAGSACRALDSPATLESLVTKVTSEVLFKHVPLSPRQIPLKKVGKHLRKSNIVAEGVGGCEVTLTSTATPHFEHLKFCLFVCLFFQSYMCTTDDS